LITIKLKIATESPLPSNLDKYSNAGLGTIVSLFRVNPAADRDLFFIPPRFAL